MIILRKRYLVCVDKIYDSYFVEMSDKESHSLSLSLSFCLSLSISLSRSLSLSLYIYLSLSLGLSFPFHELFYIRSIHSPIGLIEDDSIFMNNSILTKFIWRRTK